MEKKYTFKQAVDLGLMFALFGTSCACVIFLFFYYRLENKIVNKEIIDMKYNKYFCEKIK